jgi:hypothetical protein
MPADLINLRRARKQRARLAKEAQADENRAKFGRSKAERQQSAAVETLRQRRLDGQQIEPPVPPAKPKS